MKASISRNGLGDPPELEVLPNAIPRSPCGVPKDATPVQLYITIVVAGKTISKTGGLLSPLKAYQ